MICLHLASNYSCILFRKYNSSIPVVIVSLGLTHIYRSTTRGVMFFRVCARLLRRLKRLARRGGVSGYIPSLFNCIHVSLMYIFSSRLPLTGDAQRDARTLSERRNEDIFREMCLHTCTVLILIKVHRYQ